MRRPFWSAPRVTSFSEQDQAVKISYYVFHGRSPWMIFRNSPGVGNQEFSSGLDRRGEGNIQRTPPGVVEQKESNKGNMSGKDCPRQPCLRLPRDQVKLVHTTSAGFASNEDTMPIASWTSAAPRSHHVPKKSQFQVNDRLAVAHFVTTGTIHIR